MVATTFAVGCPQRRFAISRRAVGEGMPKAGDPTGSGRSAFVEAENLGSDFVRLCHAQSVLNPLEGYTCLSERGGNRNFPRCLGRRVGCGLAGFAGRTEEAMQVLRPCCVLGMNPRC
jgi:hypothetical protein